MLQSDDEDDFERRDLPEHRGDDDAHDLADDPSPDRDDEPARELTAIRPIQPTGANAQFEVLRQALMQAARDVKQVSLGPLTEGMRATGAVCVVIIGNDGKRRVLR